MPYNIKIADVGFMMSIFINVVLILRLLENGKLDEAQAEKLRIEQVMKKHILNAFNMRDCYSRSCKEMQRPSEINKGCNGYLIFSSNYT